MRRVHIASHFDPLRHILDYPKKKSTHFFEASADRIN
jgi:hypothetical protein